MIRRVKEDGFHQYAGLWWKLALPKMVLGVHLGIITAVSGWALRRAASRLGVVLGGLTAGWILWTPFEYAFHRWLLHHTRRPLLQQVFWQALHREHHAYRAMKDPDPDIRFMAIRTLGTIGQAARSAIPALLEAREDGRPQVREIALQTLEKLGAAP